MLFKILGFGVGAMVGFLVFNYEHGVAGGGGDFYNVYICRIDVYHAGGEFADIVLSGARFITIAFMGLVGFFVAGKITKSIATNPTADEANTPVD